MAPKKERIYSCDFPPSKEHYLDMLEFIMEKAKEFTDDPEKLFSIELSAEEALVNIIHYSVKDKLDGAITIRCRLRESDYFELTLVDNGPTFNPLSFYTSDEKKTRRPYIGGHGIHIYIKTMDHVEYYREDGKNFLILIKY